MLERILCLPHSQGTINSYVHEYNRSPVYVIDSSILESLLHWCYVYATTSSGFLSISVLPCYRTSSPSSPSASDLYAGAASPSSSRSVAQVFEYDDSGRLVIKDCTETMIKEKHSTFLCCVQTICYVLCFYGTEVAQYFKEPSLKRKLETVLSCSLLPLRHCAASIRFEFSRLARHEGLLSSDLWDFVLQPSSDALKPVPSQVQDPEVAAFYRQAQSQSAFNVLESFFPFDPCLISGLHQKVESSYRDWGGLPGVDTAITEGEIESSDGEQEEEEVEDGTLDSVASSMMSMSVMSLSNDRQHHTRSSSVALSSGSDVSHWVHQSASSPATNGMMMQQSNEDQDNYASGSQWKINARRPRQFSVGSTGSW